MDKDAPGLFSSVKRLLSTVLAIARTRIELFSVEFEEGIERLVSLVFCAVLSLFFIGIAVILITILIVVAFWDENRLLALGLLAAFFSVIGLYTGSLFMRKARSRNRLFSQSLEELAKDLSALE